MKNLVNIATFKHYDPACFLKEELENMQIECFFILSGSSVDKMDHIKVQVSAEDVEDAIKIMMKIRDEQGKELDELKPRYVARKILVPVDFTRGSEEACHYALCIAQKLKAEVKLVHVFENPAAALKMQSNETYGNYIFTLAQEAEDEAKKKMQEFTSRIREYMKEKNYENTFLHSVILMGHIVRSIKGICKAYEPDTIVLSTQGKKEGSQSIFSGLARGLVNDLKIPLFAIPGPCKKMDFDQLNILYATDFNEQDHSSLNQLLKILAPFKKDITCIHIDTAHNTANEEKIDELNNYLEKTYLDIRIHCRLIDYVNVYQGVNDVAEDMKADLLSFTIHKRSIFEILFAPDLFKKVLQEAGIPILIFPSE